MRLAVVVALAGCSFHHGVPAGTTGDASVVDVGGDDAPGVKVTSPRKLVFDNSASNIDFGPHPVLLALDATKIDYSMVADPKTDLRFEYATAGITADIGDNVPFEIERWDPNGESIVWIRVPEILRQTTDTAVLMHFGPKAAGSASSTAPWMSWELVNHLTSTLASSTGTYAAAANGVSFALGQIGEATAFSGVGDQRVAFANSGPLFDGWNAFHFSFWIYASYNAAVDLGGQPLVVDKGTSINLGRLFGNAGNIVFQLDQHYTGSNNNVYLNTIVPPKAWTNVAVNFDGNLVSLYNNGALVGSVDLTGSAQTLLGSQLPFRLGDMTNSFKGMIDELRIERRSRTVDYARAQYLNAKRMFVTYTDP